MLLCIGARPPWKILSSVFLVLAWWTPLCLFGSAPHYKKGVFYTLGEIERGRKRGPIPNRRLPLVKQTNLRDVKRLICTPKRFIDFSFPFIYCPFFFLFLLSLCILRTTGRRKEFVLFLNQQQQSYVLADLYHFMLFYIYGVRGSKFRMERACLMLFFCEGKKKRRPQVCVFWWWARYYY